MTEAMQTAQAAVQAALALGADVADARVNRLQTETLSVNNGKLEVGNAAGDFGIGLRVLKNGSWGFAALPLTGSSPSESFQRELAKRAVGLADSINNAQLRKVELAEGNSQSAEYRTPVEIDAFAMSVSDKVDFLREAEASMEGADETVVREANLSLRKEEQWHATSEGAELYQELVRTGAGISTTAAANGEVQRRSWPASFGGNYIAGGFERAQEAQLAANGARMRDESVALLSAEAVAPGKRDMILGGSQLMLQIHESVGHPNELDRVFGHEVDLAGASFATTEKLGNFQYGSDIVNLVADSTLPGGLDTRGFDDDGVPSTSFHVVKDGQFAGYHTSREWAGRLQQQSHSTNRAEGWFSPPIVRITNLSLMPGTWELDDLIADTEDGILCDTVKMWSIDQRRLNFQFTTEIGWEIKNGKRTRLLKNPTYQGNTPDFWRSCDAICNQNHWQLWGVNNCGKGNPMQVAEMTHACAPARFRGMTFL